ncbi:hypothetical protein SAMN04487895_104325 [Paenibacillus sophorae]|uniref:Uncharacterized protein n=1 Tax=Paenibacillus sophorae TaxID=1333845 RepID=A0A1H8LG71_9BACL|nr:hypothetical protein SAMN04487895_104325 [Paenibacillus sophorae]
MWDDFLYNAVSVLLSFDGCTLPFRPVNVKPSLTLTVPSVSITITIKKVLHVNVRQGDAYHKREGDWKCKKAIDRLWPRLIWMPCVPIMKAFDGICRRE